MRSILPSVALALALAGVAGAAQNRAASSRAVRRAFDAWGTGEGSIYDLMDSGTHIVIPGTAAHCGTYRKDDFLRDVAAPFLARFAEPPVPRLRTLWAHGGSVAALAAATGVTRDGQGYANTYVFAFEMAGRRVARVTQFLDMAAFNAVWDSVEPDRLSRGAERAAKD